MDTMRMCELMGNMAELHALREEVIPVGRSPLYPAPTRCTPPFYAHRNGAKGIGQWKKTHAERRNLYRLQIPPHPGPERRLVSRGGGLGG